MHVYMLTFICTSSSANITYALIKIKNKTKQRDRCEVNLYPSQIWILSSTKLAVKNHDMFLFFFSKLLSGYGTTNHPSHSILYTNY